MVASRAARWSRQVIRASSSPLKSAPDATTPSRSCTEPVRAHTTDGKPNCQSGQTGYPLGESVLQGESPANPTCGPSNVTKAGGVPRLGRNDVFAEPDGTRLFWAPPTTHLRTRAPSNENRGLSNLQIGLIAIVLTFIASTWR